MGVVYAAHDDRLSRPLAIKMVRHAAGDTSAHERLSREARAAASINHPSICQLYEIGEEDGEIFLAMELLQGESLAARIARGPMSVADVVSTALGMLTGLDALHRAGLAHRDLKPSNVFLTPHGVKLLDFGLAREVDAVTGSTQILLTTPGTIVGTPQYAAPEMLRGEGIDPRSDVFAAGAVIYEMLAGRPPFAGRTAVELFHAICYEQPPVLTGEPAIMALDRVINRALAKVPQDRYQTADALAQELRAALLLAGTQGVGAARAVTRLIALPLRILRPDPETEFLAFSLPDAVTSSLSSLQSVVLRSSLVAARFAGSTPDLKAIAAEADVDVVLAGTLMRAGDRLRVTMELLEAPAATVLWSHSAQGPVSDLFALQDDLTRGIVQALALPLTAREQKMLRHDVPSTPRAYAHYLRANEVSRETGQWRVARDLYLECIDEDPRYAPAWAALGRLHRLIAKYHEGSAPEGYARAEGALKRALELNPDLSVAENVYAHLEVDLGRASEAMVRLVRLAGTRSADPELFAGLVHACRYCGLLRASIAAFERAQRLDPGIRASIAHTWFMFGEYERAISGDNETIPYMRNAALIMMGRREEALVSLRAIDDRMPGLLISFTSALRHLLEGNIDESRAALQPIMAAKDPEARFYLARQLSHIGDTSDALAVLRGVVNDGFFCLPAMVRDPWLDPLRALPEFNEILTLAEERHRAAIVSFLTSGGDRVLGVNHPAQ